MSKNAKIAIGLAILFAIVAGIWYMNRTPATAPAPLPGGQPQTTLGGRIAGIGTSFMGLVGGIADAASATGVSTEGPAA